ncbi:hypothetical protein FA95DRAFT_1606594 [Auriscalpium vulgare]|uniref:Uncharacterized protein n=1 Tax=Auriscalpium vulgare TaxID=40419 RepID=A0ACB8RR86_9AGAM|nr:hypothetical protein FA95DRAFT_1606594 [Auriscalpium vulgare]
MPFLLRKHRTLPVEVHKPSDIVALQYTFDPGTQTTGIIRIEPLRYRFAAMKRKLSEVLAKEYPLKLVVRVNKQLSTRSKHIDSALGILKRVFQELLLPQRHRWQALSFELPAELLCKLDEILAGVPADSEGLKSLTYLRFEGSDLGQNRDGVSCPAVSLPPSFLSQSPGLASITFQCCVPGASLLTLPLVTTRNVTFNCVHYSNVEEFKSVLRLLTAASPTELELGSVELAMAQNVVPAAEKLHLPNVKSLVIHNGTNALVAPDHVFASELLLHLHLPGLTRLEVSAACPCRSLDYDSGAVKLKDRGAMALETFLLESPSLPNLHTVKFMHSELEGKLKDSFEYLLIQRAWEKHRAGWSFLRRWTMKPQPTSDVSYQGGFRDFPWPTLEIVDKGSLIQTADVERFLCLVRPRPALSMPQSGYYLLSLWKSLGNDLHFVREDDREAVERGIRDVQGSLKDILAKTTILDIHASYRHCLQSLVDHTRTDSRLYDMSWNGALPWPEEFIFKGNNNHKDDDMETFF